MLEQMGESRLALGLGLRSDAIPYRHRDDRRLAILVDDDAQAVVEREGFVRNIDRFDELGGRRGRRSLGQRRTSGDERGRQGKSDGETMETSHERSEEHTSELQSLMRISYAVFCLKKKKKII